MTHHWLRGYSPNKPYCIYIIVDAMGEIVYVGCSKNPKGRFSRHKKRFGPQIEIHIIGESAYEQTARDMECDWIRRFYNAGCNIVNEKEIKYNDGFVSRLDRELRGQWQEER
jgi:predicted GIY-YIG superfamily endonuclease